MIRVLMHARVLKMQAYFEEVRQLYLEGRQVSCRFKSRGSGQLISSEDGCRKARMMAAPLVQDLSRNLKANGQNYDALVYLTAGWHRVAVWVLSWARWELWAWIRLGCPTLRLTADASEFAYGGHVTPLMPGGFQIRGFFREIVRKLHHNILEAKGLIAVVVAAILFYEIRGTAGAPFVLAVENDNTMVIKLISKWVCKCLISCAEASWFQDLLDLRYIQVRPEFIPGKLMVAGREADASSRAKSKWWERMLLPIWFRRILFTVGTTPEMVIDLFAEDSSAQTDRFVTREFHPHALWTDAMARGWSHRDNTLIDRGQLLYAFPPERMIGRIAMQLESGGRSVERLIMVVPKLTGKPWYRKLSQMSWREPMAVGKFAAVTAAPEGKKDADKRAIPPNWELLAMFISTEHGLHVG